MCGFLDHLFWFTEVIFRSSEREAVWIVWVMFHIVWGLNEEGVQLYGLWYGTLGLSHLTWIYEGHRKCGVAVNRWKKPHICCTWYWRNLGRISFYSFKSDDLIHAVIAAIIKQFQKHQLLLRWMAMLRFYRPPHGIQSMQGALVRKTLFLLMVTEWLHQYRQSCPVLSGNVFREKGSFSRTEGGRDISRLRQKYLAAVKGLVPESHFSQQFSNPQADTHLLYI